MNSKEKLQKIGEIARKLQTSTPYDKVYYEQKDERIPTLWKNLYDKCEEILDIIEEESCDDDDSWKYYSDTPIGAPYHE